MQFQQFWTSVQENVLLFICQKKSASYLNFKKYTFQNASTAAASTMRYQIAEISYFQQNMRHNSFIRSLKRISYVSQTILHQ